MGRDKALVEIDGVSMIERVVAALVDGGCHPVSIAGGDAVLGERLGREVLADPVPDAGPLAGVAAALTAAVRDEHRWVVVAAVDLPLITGEVIEELRAAIRDDVDVVVARTDRLEPALAVWSVASRHTVVAALSSPRRALHEVMATLRSIEVAVDPRALRNVNTPDDVDTLSRHGDS